MARAHTQSQSPYTWPEPAFMHGYCPYTKPIPMHMATTHARATVHTHATDRTCATARANSSVSTRANARAHARASPGDNAGRAGPNIKKGSSSCGLQALRPGRTQTDQRQLHAHGASAAGDKEVVSAARTVCLPVHCSGRRPPSLKILAPTSAFKNKNMRMPLFA